MSLVGRILRLASFVAFLVAIADRPDLFAAPEDLYIDWPLDAMTRGGPGRALVMGHNVYVQQNFRSTTNLQFPDQEHTGLDLQLDSGGRDTENAIVRAVTDGIVECIDARRWGTQGDVIVIKHDDELYSVYGHLNERLMVRRGQRVRRGQPIGSVQRWPGDRDNTHVHFEIREFVYWSHDRDEPVESPEERPGETISCAGPGYLPRGVRLTQLQGVRTWVDPVDFYFDHRPPYPRAIVVNDLVTNLALGDNSRRTVAVYPSARIDPDTSIHLPTPSLVTALGIETAQDAEGRTQRFYKVKYDGVNEGYILGFYFVGHDSDLRVGEPLVLWQRPRGRALVHFPFASPRLQRRNGEKPGLVAR